MDRIKEQRVLFNQVYNGREGIYQAVIQKAGMSEIPYRILYAVCEGQESWSQIDICREWNYPKTSVNSAISKLVKQGYVTQTADKTSPGNRKIIELTDMGRRFCEQWVEPVIEADLQAFATLTEEERNLYIEFMARQRDSLKQSLAELFDEDTP